jgi:hypothetical protein
LPYCIQLLDNSKDEYVILNRDYKPIGFNTKKDVNYEDYPISYKLALTPLIASQLSWDKNTSISEPIYLYNDGTNPFTTLKNMKPYLEKLEILSRIQSK